MLQQHLIGFVFGLVSVSVSESPNSAWIIAHRAIALLVSDRYASERESLLMRKPTMLSIALFLPLSVSCCAIVDFPFFHFQFQFAWRIHNFPVTWRLHNAWRCRSCNTSKFRMQRSLEVELPQGCLQLDRTNNNNHFSISIIVLEIHISTTSTTGWADVNKQAARQTDWKTNNNNNIDRLKVSFYFVFAPVANHQQQQQQQQESHQPQRQLAHSHMYSHSLTHSLTRPHSSIPNN